MLKSASTYQPEELLLDYVLRSLHCRGANSWDLGASGSDAHFWHYATSQGYCDWVSAVKTTLPALM